MLSKYFVFLIGFALVHGDAPTVDSQYSSYLSPAKETFYSHYSAPSTQYGSPGKGGYGTLPTVKPSYGTPAPSYGPPPSTYGVPPQNGFESLKAFATAPESTFIQRRLFNTSVALTVPLFSFTLPQRASEGSTVDLANQVRSKILVIKREPFKTFLKKYVTNPQVIFGLFSMLVVVLIFAVPILFTGSKPDFLGRSNGQNGILEHLMSSKKVLNFMGADLTNNIGLDSTKCLQKTICEAHKYPKKYGMMATPFLIFFP